MKRLLQLWRNWVETVLVRPVPADSAVCEFDCRKLSCSQGEWETCERRKEHLLSQPSGKAPASEG